MTRTRVLLLLAVVAAAAVAFALLRGEREPRTTPAVPARSGTPGPAAQSVKRAGPVHFGIAAPADDRTESEPCSKVLGAGLYSLAAFYDRAAEHLTPFVRIHLGDLTHAPGELGMNVATFRGREILSAARTVLLAPGPADLALGSAFARQSLTTMQFGVVSANVADGDGAVFVKPYELVDAEGRTVLVVASVSRATQDEITRGGSDVQVSEPRDAVEAALAAGRAQARQLEREIAATVILHHGTLEETKELVRGLRGVSFAVAARGRDLPDGQPDRTGDVPVFESGRGGRFGWIVTVDRGSAAMWQFERLGVGILSLSSPTPEAAQSESHFVREGFFPRLAQEDVRPEDPRGRYVGASRCAGCHSERFAEHADSAHARLPERFSDFGKGSVGCMTCHMTGALRKSGWKGPTDTSDLGAVSCEACHGPGSEHAGDPKPGWGAFDLARCRTCHTADRSPEFDAEAVWTRFGHKVR